MIIKVRIGITAALCCLSLLQGYALAAPPSLEQDSKDKNVWRWRAQSSGKPLQFDVDEKGHTLAEWVGKLNAYPIAKLSVKASESQYKQTVRPKMEPGKYSFWQLLANVAQCVSLGLDMTSSGITFTDNVEPMQVYYAAGKGMLGLKQVALEAGREGCGLEMRTYSFLYEMTYNVMLSPYDYKFRTNSGKKLRCEGELQTTFADGSNRYLFSIKDNSISGKCYFEGDLILEYPQHIVEVAIPAKAGVTREVDGYSIRSYRDTDSFGDDVIHVTVNWDTGLSEAETALLTALNDKWPWSASDRTKLQWIFKAYRYVPTVDAVLVDADGERLVCSHHSSQYPGYAKVTINPLHPVHKGVMILVRVVQCRLEVCSVKIPIVMQE